MKRILLLLSALTISVLSFAQAPPQGINYQGVARDYTGAAISNTVIAVQFQIHQGSPGGTMVFLENHPTVPTDTFGLYSVIIGSVNPLSAVNWSSGQMWLEISINGSSVVTTQLQSVPYALYSGSSNGVSSITANAPMLTSGPSTSPVISMPAANGSTDGYLTQGDWTTFNNKGNGTVTSITGGTGIDGGTITGAGTFSLSPSGVSPGNYGNTTSYPTFTVDAMGRITNASTQTFTTSGGTVTSLTMGSAMNSPGTTITTTGTIDLPILGSGTTVTTSTAIPVITYDSYGRITGNTSIPINGLLPLPGSNGDVLTMVGSTPTWTPSPATINSIGTTSPLYNSGSTGAPVMSMSVATASSDGYLTQSDWNNFNNKVSTISNGTGILSANSGGTYTISADNGNAIWNANQLQSTALNISAPANGQVLRYNGTNSSWENVFHPALPAVSPGSILFSDPASSGLWSPTNPSNIFTDGTSFSIGTSTPNGLLQVVNTGTASSAVNITNTGSGYGLSIQSMAGGAGTALNIYSQQTAGSAAYISGQDVANNADVLYVETKGTGNAIKGYTGSTGNGVMGYSHSDKPNSAGVYGLSDSLGAAGIFHVYNPANYTSALDVMTQGSGYSGTFSGGAGLQTDKIQITGGSPATNYVLTSMDNFGNASWQPATGGGLPAASPGSILYADPTTSVWTASSPTGIYSDGTNIGMGTNSPAAKIDIQTSANAIGVTSSYTTGAIVDLTRTGTAGSSNPVLQITTDNNNGYGIKVDNASGAAIITNGGGPYVIGANLQGSGSALVGDVMNGANGNAVWGNIADNFSTGTAGLFTNVNPGNTAPTLSVNTSAAGGYSGQFSGGMGLQTDKIQILNGASSAGQVLTSIDAAGNATWAAPSGGGVTSVTTTPPLTGTLSAGAITIGTSTTIAAGTVGSSTAIPVIGYDTYGRIISVGTSTFSAGSGTVTNFSFTNGNGFTGSVTNSSTTPTLSLTLQNATTAQAGQLTAADWNTFNGKLSNVLANTNIFVGNGANVATGVSMAGDASILNTGVVTVKGLQGKPISATAPTANQILQFVGGTWTPTTFTAGTVTTVTVAAGVPITVANASTTPTLSMTPASSTVNGYLISTDWNTFNGKLTSALPSANIFVGNAGGTATAVAMSGDATLSNAGALTLSNSGVVANTYGNATTVPQITVDAKGRITNVSPMPITFPPSATGTNGLSGVGTISLGGNLTSVTTITQTTNNMTFTGTSGNFQVSNNNTTAALSATNGSPTTGSAGTFTITSAGNTSPALVAGTSGTGPAIVSNGPLKLGGVVLDNTSSAGNSGDILQSQGAGLIPKWQSPAGIVSAGGGWTTAGNNAAVGNFLGTVNAQDLVLKTMLAQNIIFQTNGANERMRIDALGNVGIGNTAPNYPLDVTSTNTVTTTNSINTGNGRAGNFQVINAASTITEALNVTNNATGNSRGATFNTSNATNSASAVHAVTAGTGNAITAITSGNGNAIAAIASAANAYSGNFSGGKGLTTDKLTVSGGATPGAILTAVTAAGDAVWSTPSSVLSNAWSTGGNAPGVADFLGTTNTQPLVIATTNTVTAQPIIFETGGTVEKMRIDANGNVGIGTAGAPSSILHVKASSPEIIVESTAGAFKSGYTFKSVGHEWFTGQMVGASGQYRIADITAGLTRLEIDVTGNVGIGTTTPGSQLDVVSTGTMATISGSNTGSSGSAGLFSISGAGNNNDVLIANTANSGNAIYGLNTGTGSAGNFQINNTGSTASALNAATNGGGPAISASTGSAGTSNAGNFQNLNASNGNPTLASVTNGTGSAIFVQNSNTGNGAAITANAAGTTDAVMITSSGTGMGLSSSNTNASSGGAAFFKVNAIGNNSTVMTAQTNGTGTAANFVINNAGSSAVALNVNTNGGGYSGNFTGGGGLKTDGFTAAIRNISAGSTYTALLTDYFFVVAPGAAVTINLPLPSAGNVGKVYIVKNISASPCTITPSYINASGAGGTTNIGPSTVVRFISDGANWQAW